MDFKNLGQQWEQTPNKGILPEGAKERMWLHIEKATKKKRKNYYRYMAAACMLLFVAVGGYISKDMFKPNVKLVAVTTFPQDIRLLRLPDGSRVWVNQNTTLEYPEAFSGSTREVTLKGEAFFDVARNPQKPFIITSGGITTTVLGTSFSVKAYEGINPEVRVVSGKVRVEGYNSKVSLLRGDAAVVKNTSEKLTKTKTTAAEPGFKKALIDIDGLTLNQVIQYLKKEHLFNVRYSAPDLPELKIKGTLDSRHGLNNMLNTISFALQVTITPESPGNYVISR